jgi:hypothetical protein
VPKFVSSWCGGAGPYHRSDRVYRFYGGMQNWLALPLSLRNYINSSTKICRLQHEHYINHPHTYQAAQHGAVQKPGLHSGSCLCAQSITIELPMHLVQGPAGRRCTAVPLPSRCPSAASPRSRSAPPPPSPPPRSRPPWCAPFRSRSKSINRAKRIRISWLSRQARPVHPGSQVGPPVWRVCGEGKDNLLPASHA